MKNTMKVSFLNDIMKMSSPPVYVTKFEKDRSGVDGRIVSYLDKRSYLAEQYKALRTNLYSMSAVSPIKTVVVTSAQEKEGKTITSCNLAYTISLDTEKKVVLIDADLRRPSVHDMLGIKKNPGFSDIIQGEADMDELIKEPVLNSLYIIPSGTIRSDSSEMLMSVRIKEVVNRLKARFDYVIFDTSPVMSVTDSCILGAMCDAVFLVAKAGVTQAAILEEAYHMLVGAQAKPKAAILTNVRYLMDSYHRYYKYKYYSSGDQK